MGNRERGTTAVAGANEDEEPSTWKLGEGTVVRGDGTECQYDSQHADASEASRIVQHTTHAHVHTSMTHTTGRHGPHHWHPSHSPTKRGMSIWRRMQELRLMEGKKDWEVWW